MVADSTARARILIAGGGLAGVEAALALRALAGDRVEVTILDPRRRFAVPATAAGSAFGVGPSIDRSMARVAERAGARLRRARLVAVDARRGIAMLAGGELVPYDRLIVAVGGRAEPSVPDALTFRGHADAEELRALVDGMTEAAGRGGHPELAVVVPPRSGWPLAGYEIALMAQDHFAAAGLADRCAITVLTAEETPLGAFGERVAEGVARTLARAGVTVRVTAPVRAFQWGRLELEDGEVVPADRVVALPRLRGPAIEGLPADADGFIACDPDGRARGAPRVHVVGDAASAPVRQGALACRQADEAARLVAQELGADAPPPPAGAAGTEALPWPVPRICGRHLAPLLAEMADPVPVP